MNTSNNIYRKLSYSAKILITFFISASVLSACKPPNDDQPVLQSAVNVINASIGNPAISFAIMKRKVEGESLKYTEESGYFITYPGTRDFDIAFDGQTDYAIRTNFTFQQNTYHSVFISGESTSLSTFFTTDDLTTPPAGKSKIRFVHMSPDAGGLILSVKNGVNLFPAQSYKTASQFITIDPGTYVLQLKSPNGDVLSEFSGTVAPEKIYNVWSKGMKSGVSNSPLGIQFRSIN